MEWYLKVLRNYVGFKGRARRKEYWMFVLINIVIAIALSILDRMLGWEFGENKESGVLASLYSLFVLLPSLAVLCRRLHDTDRSGWWILLGLIPIIGTLVLLVFCCLRGTPGANRFGPDPLEGEGSEPPSSIVSR
ncbi:DUF805 domain-containing protein [Enterobacteriaceae bacterium BIT-l23]|jgi:uncharacterized membrane protein YhaH (DUF805 family)|uniref:DUF805 domain-containing protein n=1 Tax=Jejubacter sp. L23 TaxID=3092086 RepID=UPI0015854EFE|nr:DUF805 domain-containing protein [Enterobacteriaceae bacterium BIT-l23]